MALRFFSLDFCLSERISPGAKSDGGTTAKIVSEWEETGDSKEPTWGVVF